MAATNARMTVGALFQTVGTAAGAVTSVLDTAVTGVNMLDNWVKSAQVQQLARAKVDESDFIDRLLEEKAQEQTVRQIGIKKFCSQSDDHLSMFQSNHTKLQSLFAKTETNTTTA